MNEWGGRGNGFEVCCDFGMEVDLTRLGKERGNRDKEGGKEEGKERKREER